jgi:hypothetical protein
VKGINARAALISLFLGLAVVTQGLAEDYYIYQAPNGGLVLSNKEPPSGSKIIKQLPWGTDTEVQQSQPANKPQPNGQAESSPKPSKAK